jgi:hypothetical protein
VHLNLGLENLELLGVMDLVLGLDLVFCGHNLIKLLLDIVVKFWDHLENHVALIRYKTHFLVANFLNYEVWVIEADGLKVAFGAV